MCVCARSLARVIRFRKKQNAARIFEENDYQVVLEETREDETGEHSISVKRMTNSTAGTSILRLLYTVVCALWTGFLFVVCLSVLLFLVGSISLLFNCPQRIACLNDAEPSDDVLYRLVLRLLRALLSDLQSHSLNYFLSHRNRFLILGWRLVRRP